MNRVDIKSTFSQNEINSILDSLRKVRQYSHYQTAFDLFRGNSDIIADLQGGNIRPALLAEQPQLSFVLLSQKAINKIQSKDKLTKLFARAVSMANQENASIITKAVLQSKLRSTIKISLQYSLQSAMEQAIGQHAFLSIYEQSDSNMTVPSAAMTDINLFTRLLPLIANSRHSDINIEVADDKESGHEVIAKSAVNGGLAGIASRIAKRAIEDPTLKKNAQEVLDNYFSVLTHQNLRQVGEIEVSNLITEELAIDYFIKLNQTVSYSEKAIYLSHSSISKLFYFINKTSSDVRYILLSAIKTIIGNETSTGEYTNGFKYKLSDEEILDLIEMSDKENQNAQTIGSLVGYLAVNSDSIPILAHVTKYYPLSEPQKRVAYEKLAIEIVKLNKAKSGDLPTMLKHLQAIVKTKTLSPFSTLLETVVVPILQNNLNKAWGAAYHTLIRPGQQDLMISIFMDFMDKQHRKNFTESNGSYTRNANIERR